jgi:membrane associated rhomboid family serine protease
MIPFNDTPLDRHKRVPIVMYSLVAINVLVFLYELTLGSSGLDQFISAFGVIPAEITTGEAMVTGALEPVYLTLITSQFIHAGLLHIGGNMLFLWVFGDNVEDAIGHIPFLFFYLAAGVIAGLSQVAISPMDEIPSIGASGAIAGVLAGYLLLYPHAPVRTLLFVGPFITITRISAVFLIAFWFVLQIFNGVLSLGDINATGGVAFFAHVGGFLFGVLAIGLYRYVVHQPVIGES